MLKEEEEEGELEELEGFEFITYDTADEFVPHNTIWKNIVNERNEKRREIEAYILEKNPPIANVPQNKEVTYLQNNIFPLLLPILHNTLFAAKTMECLKHQKSVFNGIDFIAQLLWTYNPRHPERLADKQNIFLMDWVQEKLKEKPRLIFPKSWIWNKEYAALRIQQYYRGHLVRRCDDVQEMRQFWKALKQEKEEERIKREYKEPINLRC